MRTGSAYFQYDRMELSNRLGAEDCLDAESSMERIFTNVKVEQNGHIHYLGEHR